MIDCIWSNLMATNDESLKTTYFQKNNFDLLRLVAATQVAIVHGIYHLKVEFLFPLISYLNYLPGVPIFFFLSGLLISASWERNPNIKIFSGNRIFRIIPGLWVCVLFSVILIILFSFILNVDISYLFLGLWALMQGTLFPQYSPDSLNWFGVGVVNGSLWTIPVELTFYFFLPLLYLMSEKNKLNKNKVFLIFAMVSFIVFYFLINWKPEAEANLILKKLIGFSAIPWFGMFLLGVLCQRHIKLLHKFVSNRLMTFFVIFVICSVTSHQLNTPVVFGAANDIGLINYLSLCLLILSFGYSNPELSDSILKRNDISYGIYIYHMLVFNVLILLGIESVAGFMLGVPVTIILATISWTLIEKPILRKRKNYLYSR